MSRPTKTSGPIDTPFFSFGDVAPEDGHWSASTSAPIDSDTPKVRARRFFKDEPIKLTVTGPDTNLKVDERAREGRKSPEGVTRGELQTRHPAVEKIFRPHESKKRGYHAGVQSLRGLIATLEGASDHPILPIFAGALAKAAAQANPDDALAALADQLRAFNPESAEGNAKSSDLPTALPEVAPALYRGRSGIKASEFLTTHWQPYLDAGLLHQNTLKKLDPKLRQALDNEFKGRRNELGALIPSKRDETSRLLEVAGLDHLQGQARMRAVTVLRQSSLKL